MPLGSQVSNIETIADLGGSVHEVFANDVKEGVAATSPVSQIFQDAGEGSGPGQYSNIGGSKLVGATQLRFSGGALGTGGALPDHEYQDPNRWETTPGRFYVRRAIDNFTELRAQGAGSFDPRGLIGRIFDQMWDAFMRLRIRQAIGDSDGIICKVATRVSATEITVKDGYGHPGTDPTMHLEPGMVLASLDAGSGNVVLGAARIDDIPADDTKTIEFATSIEGAGTIAANDLLVFCTTDDPSADYFDTEFGNQRNGIMTLVDPDENFTTVLGLAEADAPRWKPFREASSGFNHIEVTEHWRKLRAKSTSPVNRNTHVCVAQGAVVAELARTLVGFQQQQNLGREFVGGYQAVNIAGVDFIEDDWFLHDVMVTLCLEDLYNVDLGGEADVYSEDGSQFRRLEDYDAKEWFAREYGQYFVDRRNRMAALTDISLSNTDGDDFSPSPYTGSYAS
jgi:hypothetical protein